MQIIFTVSLPIFFLIFLGFAAARRNMLDAPGARGLSIFVFYFALPLLLFRTMARAPLAEEFDWRFIAAYLGAGSLLFLAVATLSRLFFGCRLGQQALQCMAAIFGNVVFIALPIVTAAFGPAAALPVALLITFDNIFFISLTIGILEFDRSGMGGLGRLPRATALAVLRNPVVMAVLLGAATALLGVSIPAPVDAVARLLGAAAVPCALFSLGATLAKVPISDRLPETGFMVAAKLLLHPAAVWLATGLVPDLDPLWRVVAVLTAAVPVGANVYLLAQAYDIYIARTATAVLASTALSLVTVSALLLLLA